MWDRFPAHAFRKGQAVTLARTKPIRPPVGSPNIVLQADRMEEVAAAMPGASDVAIAREMGVSSWWVGELRRIARLPEEIKRRVRALGERVLPSQISGLELRRIAALTDRRKQLSRFAALLTRR